MSDERPRFTSPLKCEHCSNVAPMQIAASFADLTRYGDVDDAPHEEGPICELLKCPACKEVTLRSYFWHEMMDDQEHHVTYKQLYPGDPRVPAGLPQEIDRAYRAAMKVKPIDANAFDVLIGRAIELVCSDRNAQGM